MDAIVVGAGLFGQVITKHLRSLGVEVTMIDGKRLAAGSYPSASLMKPSWFAGMGAQYTDPSLELLDRHYGVQDLSFRVGPAKLDGVKWCDPWTITEPPSDLLTIREVGPGWVSVSQIPPMRAVVRLEAKLVIVAAGVWTSSLLPVPGLEGKMGAACLFPGQQIDEPFISPWAPYKQLVAFNLRDNVWVGDGSAIKPANWTPERQAKTVNRCARSVDLDRTSLRIMVGNRPYVPKKYLEGRPCYLTEREPGLWIATGGAKNGTIAAGWCAHEIGRAIL